MKRTWNIKAAIFDLDGTILTLCFNGFKIYHLAIMILYLHTKYGYFAQSSTKYYKVWLYKNQADIKTNAAQIDWKNYWNCYLSGRKGLLPIFKSSKPLLFFLDTEQFVIIKIPEVSYKYKFLDIMELILEKIKSFHHSAVQAIIFTV